MSSSANKQHTFSLAKLLKLKAKFATTSLLATFVDWLVYFLLADKIFPKVQANLISRTSGMVINFFMQKQLVFENNRKLWITFIMTTMVSIGGLALGSLIIHFIGDWQIWTIHPSLKIVPKIIETGILFFYNFFLKRFAFEKRFI